MLAGGMLKSGILELQRSLVWFSCVCICSKPEGHGSYIKALVAPR